MMNIIEFLEKHWVLITFTITELGALFIFAKTMFEGIKCSLRNDILEIYDRCKDTKTITHYQLQSLEYSYKLYKKLKGNSFVDEIRSRIKTFEIID